MIFTSSDIGSFARQLWWWEHAEYVFAALVALACAGEYVADFGKYPWVVEHKDGIAKRSTLLLIGALALELICLVKTNDLSGKVIGSLGQKAAEAGEKAREAIADSSTALSQAKDALSKAETAQSSLGKAEDEANNAQTAASSALALANGARQEADSFEKDITSAKKQAADAESHLAEALRQAAAATDELNRLKTPRTLTNASAVVEALKEFKDTEYTFASVFADEESIGLLKQIDSVLQLAGWKRIKPEGAIVIPHVLGKDVDFAVPPGTGTGVSVSVDSLDSVASLRSRPRALQSTSLKAALAFRDNISSSLVPPQQGGVNKDVIVESGSSKTVRIFVGKKQ